MNTPASRPTAVYTLVRGDGLIVLDVSASAATMLQLGGWQITNIREQPLNPKRTPGILTSWPRFDGYQNLVITGFAPR